MWGTAEPGLVLRVFTQWFSSADGCRKAENIFRRLDGRTTPQSTWVEAEVKRSGAEYEALVPLDHFEAGECGWHPFVIAFQVTNPDGTSTGHFETDAAGTTRLVPGPENRIWIDAGPAREAQRGGQGPRGAAFIRPLELICAENRIRDAAGLSCVPVSPRELALISEDAKEVRVDFSTPGAPRS